MFKHAAIFPDHEQRIGRAAKELGFEQISLSSEVMQMVKMVPRGYTATADAYLTPHIMRLVPLQKSPSTLKPCGAFSRSECVLVRGRYISDFEAGFDEGLKKHVKLSFMQSDGGLSPVSAFSGHKAILSGPAGG